MPNFPFTEDPDDVRVVGSTRGSDAERWATTRFTPVRLAGVGGEDKQYHHLQLGFLPVHQLQVGFATLAGGVPASRPLDAMVSGGEDGFDGEFVLSFLPRSLPLLSGTIDQPRPGTSEEPTTASAFLSRKDFLPEFVARYDADAAWFCPDKLWAEITATGGGIRGGTSKSPARRPTSADRPTTPLQSSLLAGRRPLRPPSHPSSARSCCSSEDRSSSREPVRFSSVSASRRSFEGVPFPVSEWHSLVVQFVGADEALPPQMLGESDDEEFALDDDYGEASGRATDTDGGETETTERAATTRSGGLVRVSLLRFYVWRPTDVGLNTFDEEGATVFSREHSETSASTQSPEGEGEEEVAQRAPPLTDIFSETLAERVLPAEEVDLETLASIVTRTSNQTSQSQSQRGHTSFCWAKLNAQLRLTDRGGDHDHSPEGAVGVPCDGGVVFGMPRGRAAEHSTRHEGDPAELLYYSWEPKVEVR
eukprot:g17457.t1